MELSKLNLKYKKDEIAGFDISLNSTGVAYYAPEDDIYHTGLIKPKMTGKDALDAMGRLEFIKQSTLRILELRPTIRLAVIEDYAMSVGRNKKSGLAVREAGGIVKNVLHSSGVDLLLVSPTSLKLFATGKGNADQGDSNKSMMRYAANAQFGVVRKTTDEIDAFWLLQVGMYVAGCNVRDRKRRERVDGINGSIYFKSNRKR